MNKLMSETSPCNLVQVHQLKRSCWYCVHMKHNCVLYSPVYNVLGPLSHAKQVKYERREDHLSAFAVA